VRPPLLVLLIALTLSAEAAEFDVRPAPAWVDPLEVVTNVVVAKQNVRWGIYDILSDHQVRGGSEYYRTVRKVLSSNGVQNASELELDFDPSFERLVIHEITLIRDGVAYDALERDTIRVIDKEDDAANRIYDGQRTALIFLRDIRPGDVLDYSWSVNGANPILGGRYTDEYDLSSVVPSRHIRHRLLWPKNRDVKWSGAPPATTVNGDELALLWEAKDVPALDVEDAIPTWYEPWQSVQVSEFASWRDVALWADAMFRLDERSVLEVRELANELRAAHKTRDAQITAAIRFVQDDIRYLGLELGRNSHEPHQPWETLDARWGDCKDKSLLLVALLRELGVEAYPALVNTRLQHRLEERLPSPFLFDHVIAQVIDGGRTYWVDGTISEQGGTLAAIDTPSDGRALIVRPETTALAKVLTTAKAATRVEQTYTTTKYDQPALLEVRTTYSGGDADAKRAELATLSIEDYAHARINRLAVDQPKIEADGSPTVSDDRLRNVIVVTERYRIPELWNDGHWVWYPRVLESNLVRPDTMIREMPLAFAFPLNVEQIARFNLPENIDVEKSTSVTETPTFRYEYDVDSNGRTVTIRQSLVSRRDSIDAKDVAGHLTKLNAIWSEIGYRLAPPGANSDAGTGTVSGSTWSLGLMIVALFVGMCWMLATRRPHRPAAPRPAFLPGEAPMSALAVHGPHDIDSHLAGRACPCGARVYSDPDTQHARYAERELVIVTRSCGACGREQSLYFTAA
jgi:transglutaminase-like putative cysteine protease